MKNIIKEEREKYCTDCGFYVCSEIHKKDCQPSEEKDQYGHKIIRPTLPDDTFAGLKEEIKERVSEEKELTDSEVFVKTKPEKSYKAKIVVPKQEEWEEDLKNILKVNILEVSYTQSQENFIDDIKSFISQLLKKEREKVIEEFKKNTKDLTKYETEFTCPCGQEHSVQFLIRKPKVMKGKITEITINSQQLKK